MIFINIISIYFLVIAAAATFSAAHIGALSHSAYARTIVVLCFAICFYIVGYCMELNAVSTAQILFWNQIEYIGIPFVSALWMTAGLLYTGHFTRHKKALCAFIFIIPFITLVLRMTDSYYHFYFSSLTFVHEYGKLLLVKHAGPWMLVQTVHSFLMICITMSVFTRHFLKNIENKIEKIVLVAAASLFAAAGLFLSLTKPFGIQLDYMAMCLPVSCMLVIWAIRRYDFLEFKPLARSEAFEFSKDAILLVNWQNRIIDYNKRAKYIFSQMSVSIDNQPLETLLQHAPELLDGLMSTKPSIIRLPIDQHARYFEIRTKSISVHRSMHGWIKTIHDITEIYQLNQDLKRQAMIDELSGLYNRRSFMQSGQQMMSESDRAGSAVHLLMTDLDHFKNVNDQYGHQMGDLVIRRFGEILKAATASGGFAARLGGEEFAIMLPGSSDADAEMCAYTILQNIRNIPFLHQGQTFHVTASIGISKKTEPAQTIDNLLHMADKMLYQSKDRGRNCVTMSSQD